MDEIAKRTPINKQAANVVSKGVAYVPKKKILVLESDTPIPIASSKLMPFDLTGIRFGRLTVIGLAKDMRSRWVCRCDCGIYTIRRSKAVRNPGNQFIDRCETCRHYEHQKRTNEFRSKGYNSTDKWSD